MDFRIGINLGDVVHEEGRIYGDGVNIAARLEALAEPSDVGPGQAWAGCTSCRARVPTGDDGMLFVRDQVRGPHGQAIRTAPLTQLVAQSSQRDQTIEKEARSGRESRSRPGA